MKERSGSEYWYLNLNEEEDSSSSSDFDSTKEEVVVEVDSCQSGADEERHAKQANFSKFCRHGNEDTTQFSLAFIGQVGQDKRMDGY